MAKSSLSSLPAEILLEIQSLLSYGSCLALCLTCRDIYSKAKNPNRTTDETVLCASNSPPPKENAYSMVDLLEIELWPEYNAAKYRPAESKQPVDKQDFFACFLCLKIRSASNFSNAMMKGKRGKLGTGAIAEKIGRFCITCGLSHQRYQRGICFQFGGALGRKGFVCRGCGNFEQIRYGCEAQTALRTCASCCYRVQRRHEPVDLFYVSIDCSDWRDILS